MAEDTVKDLLPLIQGFVGTQANLQVLHQKVDALSGIQERLCKDVGQILQMVRDGYGTEKSLQRRADEFENAMVGVRRELDDIHHLNQECREDREQLRKMATQRRWNVYVSVISGLFSLVAVGIAVWLKR